MNKLTEFWSEPQPDDLQNIYIEFQSLWLEFNSGLPDPDYTFSQLQISDFLIKGHQIYIRLKRPGVLMGANGKCFDFILSNMRDKFDSRLEIVIDDFQYFLY